MNKEIELHMDACNQEIEHSLHNLIEMARLQQKEWMHEINTKKSGLQMLTEAVEAKAISKEAYHKIAPLIINYDEPYKLVINGKGIDD